MEVNRNRPSFELLVELIICKGHYILASLLSDTVKNLEEFPGWLSEGITYLLPKINDTVNPKNCRPKTCLNKTCTLLTSIITERMYVFMETNNLFPIEQKVCRRGSYGCKDQLLINRMIIKDYKSKHRNLSMALIDYRKAFDSVPHSCILKVLDLFKISRVLINFLRINMSM